MPAKTNGPKYTVQDVLHELEGESDRAAAIVGAAWLDDLLARMLAAFFIKDKEADRLIGTDGAHAPLSSFALRARLAYCLGLLTEDERDDLMTIATIRNLFAHRIHRSTFANHKIGDLCLTLKRGPLVMPQNQQGIPRQAYQATVALLSFTLSTRRESLDHRSPIKPPSLQEVQAQVAAA